MALLSAAAFWYGQRQQDLILFVFGIFGGMVLCVAASLVLGVAARLRRPVARPGRKQPLTVEAGFFRTTGFGLPLKWWMGLVDLEWQWAKPLGVQVRIREGSGLLAEKIRPGIRCHVSEIVREFTAADRFGLCQVTWRIPESRTLTILPFLGGLRKLPTLLARAGGGREAHWAGSPLGERLDIRRYIPGDSVRNILWKSFARTRELNARVPESSLQVSTRTVAFLITGRGDEAAAAAARAAIEEGALGIRWSFGTSGSPDPVHVKDAALIAIARSGSGGIPQTAPSINRGEGDLLHFLDRVYRAGARKCVLFVPARPGCWIESLIRVKGRWSGDLAVIVGFDGPDAATGVRKTGRASGTFDSREKWRRDLKEVLRRLSSEKIQALVLDRLTGRTFGMTRQRRNQNLRPLV